MPVKGREEDVLRHQRGEAGVARRGSKARSTEKGPYVLAGAPSIVGWFLVAGELHGTRASPMVGTGGPGGGRSGGSSSIYWSPTQRLLLDLGRHFQEAGEVAADA